MTEDQIERIKEIIRNVEAIQGSKSSNYSKQQEMLYAYEAIRDTIFEPLEVERMREDE